VDLHGETQAAAVGEIPYGPNSIQLVASNSKTISSIVFARMKQAGVVDYDEKVSTYWPEFAQNGKENIKVCDVLRHDARMPKFPKYIEWSMGTPENLKKNQIGEIIEGMKQCNLPHGATRTYHTMSKDWILNEIFRRVEPTGRTMGEYFRAEMMSMCDDGVFITCETDEELKRCYDVALSPVSRMLYDVMNQKMNDP
jgi:CubicO group peptidase (beta-lactamase class C family)